MNWLRKILYGRYGSDALGRAMIFLSLAFLIFNMLFNWRIFYWVALILLVLSYFRIFSKNIAARRGENEAFLRWWYPIRQKFSRKAQEVKDQKTHVHCKCPGCGQKIRVPRGHGKINITCPQCGQTFLKKT